MYIMLCESVLLFMQSWLTAESLAKTARELKGITPDEWLTVEEAAAYLKKTPKAFEKIVARGEIPWHYLTERGILFFRKELD